VPVIKSAKEHKHNTTVIKMILIIVIIIMYCNNHFIGKYWAVLGPKLSGSPYNPDYQGMDC